LKHMKEIIRTMPNTDHPLAFGQHMNADISSQIDDANVLIEVLVGLQPTVVTVSDDSGEDPLAKKSLELLDQAPPIFDIRAIKQKMESRSDPDPLKTVLYQELDRYNRLLSSVRGSLANISKAIQGLVAVTTELEDVMDALTKQRVPKTWGKTYPSLKPLGSWFADLVLRCAQFEMWQETELPKYFWLSGFTYPSGFLTAVLQTSARLNGVPIDALSWEFPVLQHNDTGQINAYPKEGVYVTGLFVEGACWSFSSGFFEEPKPMELVSNMPLVHFRPVEGKRKSNKGYYSCPIYMYPFRSGTRERPSYVVSCELRCGKFSAEFWTKRGVALLLSTSL